MRSLLFVILAIYFADTLRARAFSATLPVFTIVSASSERKVGTFKESKPNRASQAAPKVQPTVNPATAGHVFLMRSAAFAASSRFERSSKVPISAVRRTMLVVITAVAGAPLSDTCTRPFWTAIAETPSKPPTEVMLVSGSQSLDENERKKGGQQYKLQQEQWSQRIVSGCLQSAC